MKEFGLYGLPPFFYWVKLGLKNLHITHIHVFKENEIRESKLLLWEKKKTKSDRQEQVNKSST